MARNERFDPFDRKNVCGFDAGWRLRRSDSTGLLCVCNTDVTTEMCELFFLLVFFEEMSAKALSALKFLKAAFSVSVKGSEYGSIYNRLRTRVSFQEMLKIPCSRRFSGDEN